MADGGAVSPTAGMLVDNRVWQERLVREMELAVDLSESLQNAIHELHLAQLDKHSRAALQCADKLTQCLQCLTAALTHQDNGSSAESEVDIAAVIGAIFLEDIRRRLSGGPDDPSQPVMQGGQVDIF